MSAPPAPAFGAVPVDARRTRFRLWAPLARQVALLREGQPPLPMQRQDDGSHELLAEAPAGSAYRYRLDGHLDVPDPASRAQRGDVDGWSLVVDPRAWAWRHADWRGRPWREAVICEVHAGLAGGFDGLRARLPGLAAAGYTAIELMPLAEFPGARNWGYDGVLPYAPESAYGPPEALAALIDAAHGLGLMVLLDVVYNHFGPDGNFIPRYAPGFFRDDIATPWGPAIDFRQPPVRRFFIDNARQWLADYRFDGLRLDAVHTIQPESFLLELAAQARAACAPGRRVHLILENEHNAARLLRGGAFDAQWNDDGHNALHVLLTGEHEGYYADYAKHPVAAVARMLGEGFVFQGQCDRRGHPRGEPSGDLPPEAFVLFLQNHDQIGNRALGERLAALVPAPALQAATALVALCPMTPLFFMGEEWGSRVPFFFFTSHKPALAEQVREGRRAEFARFAGFADPARRAAIPDPNDAATYAASDPERDADGPRAEAWRAWFADLLRVRREHLLPRLAGVRPLGATVLAEGALAARWRLGDGSLLELVANLGELARAVPPAATGDTLYVCSPETGAAACHAQGRLPAHTLLARLLAPGTSP
ncbi:malto-oligosyltrehalose trehalohydrolase [Frateuria defendens]|uniref:malto-oligosyltrehalose trehalohydrolase n=1 Tax=Frateuria defendens TaxID=2219559 RepID=UPI00066FC874|nr:malto-oligosyltrehalose trehalohydrolase [Frateuria defendens]